MAERFIIYAHGAGLYGAEDTETGKIALFGPHGTAEQMVSLLNMNAIPVTGLAWTDPEEVDQ